MGAVSPSMSRASFRASQIGSLSGIFNATSCEVES